MPGGAGARSGMGRHSVRSGRLILLALAAATGIGATAAHHRVIAVLDGAESGQWALRDTSGAEPRRLVCLGDGTQLLQLHHGNAACSRLVLNNERDQGTVSYTCPGTGHGQTMVSLETPRILHLRTQGLANGAPFDVAYEARFVGPCGASGRR